MKKSLLLFSALGLSLCSCTTITHTADTEAVNTEVYNLTVADLNVANKKETVTTEWKWNPFSPQSLSAQKETAQHELMEKADADLIVEPQFTVKRRGIFRGGSLTVTGYPAKYSNFRNMTKEDAEKIGIINGTLSTVVVNPVVSTSNGKVIKPAKVKKWKPEVPDRQQFVDFIYGPQFDMTDELDTGYQIGLMYGSYGKKWGWYAKLALASAEGYDGSSYEYSRTTTAYVSGGFIRTISRNWNFLMGLGLGGYNCEHFEENDSHSNWYYSPKSKFSIPIEAAVQWRTRRFNLMFGVNYATPLSDGDGNLTPFLGIGYSF